MATNVTSHKRFFAFQRRSSTGATLPTWLTYPGSKAYLRRFVRTSKTDSLVDEVEIINVNPNYANVHHLNGWEVTVSLNDLSPFPSEESQDNTDTNRGAHRGAGGALAPPPWKLKSKVFFIFKFAK